MVLSSKSEKFSNFPYELKLNNELSLIHNADQFENKILSEIAENKFNLTLTKAHRLFVVTATIPIATV